MNTTLTRKLLQLSLIASLAFALFACSKSGDDDAKKPLFEASVLNRLPQDTHGFVLLSTISDGFKKFESSGWGTIARRSMKESLTKLTTQIESPALKSALDALVSSKLIALETGEHDAVATLVVYFGDEHEGSPRWGIIATAATDVALDAKLKEISASLASKNIQPTPLTGGDSLSGFSVTPAGMKKPLYFVGSEKLLAVGEELEVLKKALGEAPEGGITRIKALPQFAKSTQELPTEGQFVVGFADTIPLAKALKAAADKQLPTGTANSSINLDTIPLDAIAFSRTMSDGLVDTLVAPVTPRDKDQMKLVNALTSSTKGQLIDVVPADVVAYLGLDGGSLASLKNAAVEDMAAQGQPLPAELALIDAVRGISLSLRKGAAASAFPDLILAIRTPQAGEIRTKLKEYIALGLESGAGMPAPQWMNKEIEGVPTEYFLTPFGVGLFISQVADVVIVASSESSVAEVMNSVKGSKKSLLSTLPSSVSERLKQRPAVVAGFVDFARLGTLIEEVQGSLAMFTGGTPPVDSGQVAHLKQLGSFTTNLSFHGQVLRLETLYGEPPVQK
jgi:hypothetical protein